MHDGGRVISTPPHTSLANDVQNLVNMQTNLANARTSIARKKRKSADSVFSDDSFDEASTIRFYAAGGPAREMELENARLRLLRHHVSQTDRVRQMDAFRPACVRLMATFLHTLPTAMCSDTFYIAVYCFDAYVAVALEENKKKWKLMALISAWVAVKVNETKGYKKCRVSHIRRIVNYEEEEILEAERDFLRLLEYRCTPTTVAHYAEEYITFFLNENPFRYFSKMAVISHVRRVLENIVQDTKILQFEPSKIAFGVTRYVLEEYLSCSIAEDDSLHVFAGYDEMSFFTMRAYIKKIMRE